ncbi:MAG: GTPase HflX [Phycisphaeraceae bacterium]|nr:GTPase HflX [Phycisphaeraceae bacterium]
MEDGKRTQLAVESEPAILAGVLFPNGDYDPHDPLGELRSLADTAGAVVCDELIQQRQKPVASTFMGTGKVEELAGLVKAHDAKVVLFENDLSPSQIGKIEEVVQVKVLDRSELILDIFAARAQTYESRLQVELAQLEYTYPRLRAMWTHLERIAGGAPAGIGTRGPGEQQLEIDRRIVQRRKSELKREIAMVQSRKTREVAQRNRDNYTVGLVGYTNAGKSTLFNTLTGTGTYADDKLFATLSTLTRKLDLGGGDSAMLSDTVGFVRDLPHHLVASFKSTLEEAVNADMLLVVLDASHPRAHNQLNTVMEVLDDIGATSPKRQLLLNKTDLLEHNADLLVFEKEHPDAIAISAKTGVGLDKVIERIRDGVHGMARTLTLQLPLSDGKSMTFLENRTTVINREYVEQSVRYTVNIGNRQMDQLRSAGAKFEIIDEPVTNE